MTNLRIEPVTPSRWSDLLELFGPNGAYSNCWCTWFLLTGKQWEEAAKEERRKLLEALVVEGLEPGLLAYREGTPVGWCAVGPRERYARFMSPRSTLYRRIDDAPTWVINCFFIHREHRNSGVATALLAAAIDFARERGATMLEGYPIDREDQNHSHATLFVGALSMFLDSGFEEVSRVRKRPLVRRTV